MKKTASLPDAPPSRGEALLLLKDTAKAVKVMKASWLHVAMNLKRIRRHELWRYNSPPCSSYEEYVLEVLELNKYVAARMLRAMNYTEERRPDVLRSFETRGEDAAVPSYETIDRLRRIQDAFGDREADFREIESRVFDDGIGRVTLKRAIDEKLGRGRPAGGGEQAEEPSPVTAAEAPLSLDGVIDELMAVERKLLRLQVSKEARRLAFRLIEVLQKERDEGQSETD